MTSNLSGHKIVCIQCQLLICMEKFSTTTTTKVSTKWWRHEVCTHEITIVVPLQTDSLSTVMVRQSIKVYRVQNIDYRDGHEDLQKMLFYDRILKLSLHCWKRAFLCSQQVWCMTWRDSWVCRYSSSLYK